MRNELTAMMEIYDREGIDVWERARAPEDNRVPEVPAIMEPALILNAGKPVNSEFIRVLGLDPQLYTNYEPLFMEALIANHAVDYAYALKTASREGEVPDFITTLYDMMHNGGTGWFTWED